MSSPIRLLVIDDEQSILELVRLIFRADPSVVLETLSDPSRWQEAIRHFRPDVLLVDFRMPEVNGGELLKMLQQTGLRSTIHGVGLFSATPLPAWEIQQLGADTFLPKPFNVDELIERVHDLSRSTA